MTMTGYYTATEKKRDMGVEIEMHLIIGLALLWFSLLSLVVGCQAYSALLA